MFTKMNTNFKDYFDGVRLRKVLENENDQLPDLIVTSLVVVHVSLSAKAFITN